ncbi:MAG: Fic family protein [Gammaproteobacteria bacterium]|nr:Fic family protein [Gammaproteobacteria bacterium]
MDIRSNDENDQAIQGLIVIIENLKKELNKDKSPLAQAKISALHSLQKLLEKCKTDRPLEYNHCKTVSELITTWFHYESNYKNKKNRILTNYELLNEQRYFIKKDISPSIEKFNEWLGQYGQSALPSNLTSTTRYLTYRQLLNILNSNNDLLSEDLKDLQKRIVFIENKINDFKEKDIFLSSPVDSTERYFLYKELFKQRDITKNNPLYFMIIQLEMKTGFKVHDILSRLDEKLKIKLQKRPEILFEAQLAITYAAKAFDFYHMDYLNDDSLLHVVEQILQSDKDVSLETNFYHFKGIFKEAIVNIIRSRLEEEERLILGKVQAQNISLNDANQLINYFSTELETTPHSYALQKLLTQAEVYQAMQDIDPQAKVLFPFTEIWRFVIDGNREQQGAYVFENEPGYIKGTLKGLLHALQSYKCFKDPAWYIQLHDICINEVYKSLGWLEEVHVKNFHRGYTEEDIASAFELFKKGTRDSSVENLGYCLTNLSQDWIGKHDLTDFKRQDWCSINRNWDVIEFLKKSPEEINQRLSLLFSQYQELLTKSNDQAEKLMIHLWLCREMEIHHFFEDGNGRTCMLAAMSMLCSEGLPLMLFDDPNVFDAHGPEQLCQFAINAMCRYQQFCQGPTEQLDKLRELVKEKFHLVGWQDIISQIMKRKVNEEQSPTLTDHSIFNRENKNENASPHQTNTPRKN